MKDKIKKLYRISKSTAKYLNYLDNLKDFPWFLRPPTINKKINQTFNKLLQKDILIANSNIKKGEILFDNNGTRVTKKLNFSIQVNKKRYIILPKLTHNCQHTNCNINNINQIVASKAIKEGDELVFNYFTTEYSNKEKKLCICKAKKCLKKLTGFKYLSTEQQTYLINNFKLSNYIKFMINLKHKNLKKN